MTRARDIANLIGSGNFSSTTFTATAGQTAFTISHTQGFVQVFMNGLLLDETVDFTSNGTAITLTSGAAAGDEIEVVKYDTFSVGDAITQTAADTRYVNTTGDTMSGDLTVSGNLTVSGGLVSATGTSTANNTESDIGLYHSLKNLSSDVNTGVALALGSNNNSGAIIYGQRTGANNEHKMGFQTRNSSGSAATRMAIDGSGHVTMPSQPGFSYLGSKQYVIGGTGTTVMDSSNVWSSNVNHGHNRGSHFNAATGRFTCPVAGRYLFIFTCQASDFGSGYLWFYMRLNQSIFSYSQKSQQNTWTSHIHHAVMELNANDYVDIAWTNNYVSGQIHMPGFTGQLIS